MNLRFVQFLGECQSKEWIAKVPNSEDDEGNHLWALIRITTIFPEDVDEDGQYIVELCLCRTDIDWIEMDSKRESYLELLSDQFFNRIGAEDWSETGSNPIDLLLKARKRAECL